NRRHRKPYWVQMRAICPHPGHDLHKRLNAFTESNGALKTVREDIDVARIAVVVHHGGASNNIAVRESGRRDCLNSPGTAAHRCVETSWTRDAEVRIRTLLRRCGDC